MKSQPQIQAIQAKLQAIHSSRTASGFTELVDRPPTAAKELPQGSPRETAAWNEPNWSEPNWSESNQTELNKSDSKTISGTHEANGAGGRSPQRSVATMVELRPPGKTMPNTTGPNTTGPNTTGISGSPSGSAKRSPVSSVQMVSTVEDLNQRSNQYLQHFQTPPFLQPLSPQPQPPSSPRQPYLQQFEQKLANLMQQLEAQAEQINQLSMAQEVAVQELRAIAQRAEREWRALELEGKLPFDWETYLPAFECSQAAVPLVQRDADGAFILTAKPVDLYQAEREAASTAEALRQRLVSGRDRVPSAKSTVRRSRKPSKKTAPLGFLKPLLAFLQDDSSSAAPARSLNSGQVREAHWGASSALTMPEAAMWLLGAIVVRGGINLVLSAVPGLWLLMVGLMVVPAAIAIYRMTTSPQASFVWGYRLFLAMVGLLIGGRLL